MSKYFTLIIPVIFNGFFFGFNALNNHPVAAYVNLCCLWFILAFGICLRLIEKNRERSWDSEQKALETATTALSLHEDAMKEVSRLQDENASLRRGILDEPKKEATSADCPECGRFKNIPADDYVCVDCRKEVSIG